MQIQVKLGLGLTLLVALLVGCSMATVRRYSRIPVRLPGCTGEK
jgi:hypothetical protein